MIRVLCAFGGRILLPVTSDAFGEGVAMDAQDDGGV